MGKRKQERKAEQELDALQEKMEDLLGEENVIRVTEKQVAVRIRQPEREPASDGEMVAALTQMQEQRENFWYAVLFELAMYRQAMRDEEELGDARNMLDELGE